MGASTRSYDQRIALVRRSRARNGDDRYRLPQPSDGPLRERCFRRGVREGRPNLRYCRTDRRETVDKRTTPQAGPPKEAATHARVRLCTYIFVLNAQRYRTEKSNLHLNVGLPTFRLRRPAFRTFISTMINRREIIFDLARSAPHVRSADSPA